MKKIIVFSLIALLLFSVVPMDSYAGPWTLKKGKVWVEVFTRYFFSKNNFDSEGNLSRWDHNGHSQIWDVEGKIEYGLTDNINLLASVPYTWSRWKNDWTSTYPGNKHIEEKNEGFKQITLGAKYKFMVKPVVAAIQVKGFLHSQNTDKRAAPDLFEYGDAIEVRGLIGKAFNIKKRSCYIAFESGYRWESDWANESTFANSIPIFAEAGFSPFDWLMLKGEIDFRYSHQGTGVRKDGLTWRAGPIISLLGKGFSSVKKGGETSLNLELQYGQTVWGRGDGNSERYNKVSQAQEFIAKVQYLF